MGPRACYDEAKRFGVTLSYSFAENHWLPVRIAMPFNSFGSGMSIYDKWLPSDFSLAFLKGEDLDIHTDGLPTRSSDIFLMLSGYLKVMLHKNL